ncbi:ABC transporter substrate-binding protein [Actinomadura alba]|uniref:ABC transporter substrate-binding protein n=1 Tax=Actinomadura alba TaxID=406431 RepID=A0ABR7LVM2_9ACTN|nr:ABC transporter substrate-binding protein [Actinomadura alba]MBC6468893.1 ABC transporter substrate-binding protein [Actinomadura alba]
MPLSRFTHAIQATALAVLIAGCAGTSTSAPGAMGSAQGEGVFPRTVTHFLGRTEIPAAPKRIVALSSGQLDGVLALGVVPVAATMAIRSELVPVYLARAFPQHSGALAGMVNLGTRFEPNLEAVIAARPDLILMNNMLAELYPKLSRIAPTVVAQGTGDHWKRDLLIIGAALGRHQQATAMVAAFQRDAAALARRVGDDATVSIVRFAPGRSRMFGSSSFPGSIVADIGLARPASQRFSMMSRDLSDEQVNKVDATWIFYSAAGRRNIRTGAQTIQAGELWQRLRAVHAGNAVQVDEDPWYYNAGPIAARVVLNDIAAATRA